MVMVRYIFIVARIQSWSTGISPNGCRMTPTPRSSLTGDSLSDGASRHGLSMLPSAEEASAAGSYVQRKTFECILIISSR
jgi:hypothetical protein